MNSFPAVLIFFLLQTTPIPGMWQKVDALPAGTSLEVLLKSGQPVFGWFQRSSEGALVLKNDAGLDVTLAKADIQKVIRPRGRDRLRNGALIGAASGFAAGFLALFAFDRGVTESGYRFEAENAAMYTYAGLLGAGIGAASGALIDKAIKGDEVLFQAR